MKATFAAGCFWHVEHAFRQVPGVTAVVSGYTGGHAARPSYEAVCTGATGHAEAVQVAYDERRVSYEALLDTFWKIHDPTTVNRQGPDVGSQYRSVIFYHGPAQQALARASKRRQMKYHARPIVTAILEAKRFYPAEKYHQRYLERHGLVACPL